MARRRAGRRPLAESPRGYLTDDMDVDATTPEQIVGYSAVHCLPGAFCTPPSGTMQPSADDYFSAASSNHTPNTPYDQNFALPSSTTSSARESPSAPLLPPMAAVASAALAYTNAAYSSSTLAGDATRPESANINPLHYGRPTALALDDDDEKRRQQRASADPNRTPPDRPNSTSTQLSTNTELAHSSMGNSKHGDASLADGRFR